jgi:hypothetical protein
MSSPIPQNAEEASDAIAPPLPYSAPGPDTRGDRAASGIEGLDDILGVGCPNIR